MRPVFAPALDLLASLAPCAACERAAASRDGVCSACRVRLAGGPRVARVTRDGVTVLALGRYDGALREAVHAIKFGGRPRLAVHLGGRLGRAIRDAGWPVARVVPVPLHRRRKIRRGFDQADRIAVGVADGCGAPRSLALRRVVATPRQARARGARRSDGWAGTFTARRLPPIPIVLVDDVWTSGTTARAARAALLEAGAREVRVAVVARADAEASTERSQGSAGPARRSGALP